MGVHFSYVSKEHVTFRAGINKRGHWRFKDRIPSHITLLASLGFWVICPCRLNSPRSYKSINTNRVFFEMQSPSNKRLAAVCAQSSVRGLENMGMDGWGGRLEFFKSLHDLKRNQSVPQALNHI
jgi:hypothetical protein